MVHQPGEEIELGFEQPVRDPVQPQCEHARVEQHFPPRPWRGVPLPNGVEIVDQTHEHRAFNISPFPD